MAGIINEPLLSKFYEETTRPVRTRRCWAWLPSATTSQWLLAIIVSGLAMYGFFDVATRVVESGISVIRAWSEQPACWCGTSDQEAVSVGCMYDHIAVDWLPPFCRDQELVDEFDCSGPNLDGSWSYYSLDDKGLFSRINASDIDSYARRGLDYWSTVEWHIAHCLFTWRKQFRKDFRREAIEPWNMKEAHVVHCTAYTMEVLREGRILWEADTLIPGRDRHVGE